MLTVETYYSEKKIPSTIVLHVDSFSGHLRALIEMHGTDNRAFLFANSTHVAANASRNHFESHYLRNTFMGWKDVSEVKNTDCSCRGPWFYSQDPHKGS